MDATYKKSAETGRQGIERVGAQLKSNLDLEQATGVEQEQKRHDDWLKEHIKQTFVRDNSEQDRQKSWNERFSSPEQLWIVMREEWRLAQEKIRYDLSQRRTKQQKIIQEFQSWFENKKLFYFSKIQSWAIALQEAKKQ